MPLKEQRAIIKSESYGVFFFRNAFEGLIEMWI